jgi:hypothetical protein
MTTPDDPRIPPRFERTTPNDSMSLPRTVMGYHYLWLFSALLLLGDFC